MAQGQLASALHYLRRLIASPATEDASDRHLLRRFASDRDEPAFEALVRRHGPMVLGVCRRVLGDEHEAEDAFQAVFLVLARKAGSVGWRDSIGGWLYAVARRVATKARAGTLRRRVEEVQAEEREPMSHDRPSPLPDPETVAARREVFALLEEELQRLPEKYRAPLVLCYLEGKTNEQAAQQLGWPVGSMSRHLARGRELLGQRLAQRGVALSAAGLAGLLADGAAAAVPAVLVNQTVKAALTFVAGKAAFAGVISTEAAVLAEGALNAMMMSKLKLAAVAVLVIGVAGLGAGGIVHQVGRADPAAEQPAKQAGRADPAAEQPAKAEAKPRQEKKAKALPGKPQTEASRRLAERFAALAQPVNIDKGIDPNTPLKDALDFLVDRYDLTILIDSAAFEEQGLREVETQPVRLPKLIGVTLSTVLRLLLDQVDGNYVAHPDYIEIVPKDRVRSLLGMKAKPRMPQVPQVPWVDYQSFNNIPLAEALNKLARATQTTVILDARGREIAKMPVVADFRDVSLADAVRVLADMADLKAVALNKGFYVTTRANADALEAEQKKLVPQESMQAGQKKPVPRESTDPLPPLPPLVSGTIDKLPLAEALEILANQTDVSVILEQGAGEVPVSGVFKNASLEAAVRVLADMAGLKPVMIDNVLYVTTRAKADALEAEQQKRHLLKKGQPKPRELKASEDPSEYKPIEPVK